MALLGQEHLTNALREAMRRDTLHHAYLFAGPAGMGKQDAALWLAQLANCEAEPEMRPCGACHQCRLVAAHNHPDVSWIFPSEKSKAGKILIEQAQQVRTEVSRRPVLGGRKITVLAPADDLTLDAVNCLLKTLEEPPDYATLVLLAGDTANVIPTVLSRCQVMRFQPVPQNVIADDLVARGADRPTAERLAALAGGRPGEARRLFEDAEAMPRRERALDWLEAVAGAEPMDALRLAHQLRAGAEGEAGDVPDTLHWAGHWFRDVLAIQTGAEERFLFNRDRTRALGHAAGRYPLSQTQAALPAILRARRYLAGNANAQLAMENLVMDLIPQGGAR